MDDSDSKTPEDKLAAVSPKTPKTEAETPSPKKKKKGKRNWSKSSNDINNNNNNKTAAEGAPSSVGKENDDFAHTVEDDSIAHSTFASAIYSCCGQPFQIHSVFSASGHPPHSPGATRMKQPHAGDLAVVYTCGLHDCGLHFEGGFPEFVVFDVPACKVEQVCRLFAFLAHQMEDHRLVKGGEIVDSDDLVMETKWVACPRMRARLFDRFPFLTGMSAGGSEEAHSHFANRTPSMCKWLALQPQFAVTPDKSQPRYRQHLSSSSYSKFWGSRPPAPHGRTNERNRIVDIFMTKVVLAAGTGRSNSSKNAAPGLIWHVDGNPNNNSLANTQEVTLHEAFSNKYMNVDWSRFLDGDQALISYTKANMDHFATIFKPRGGKVMVKHDEEKIRFKYHLEYLYSPSYSPADSNHQQRGYLNLDSPNFQPHHNTSLPEFLPFGF